MADNSKYSLFMDELSSLEKHILTYLQEVEDIHRENQELRDELLKSKKENEILKSKINEFEEKLSDIAYEGTSLFKNESFNLEDKENLKNKINELISKLDYHLRS